MTKKCEMQERGKDQRKKEKEEGKILDVPTD